MTINYCTPHYILYYENYNLIVATLIIFIIILLADKYGEIFYKKILEEK